MKKFAALSLASFYLLLTTGMFMCVVSCGSSQLMEVLASNFSSESHCHNEKENHSQERGRKHCNGDESCSCCKQHGTFIVKENIKPDNHFQLLEIPVITKEIACLISYTCHSFETNTDGWPEGNAPPGVVKIPLYISNRTLLI